MRKILCPCCCSSNTAIGVAQFSTNVSLVCNFCGLRDVVYFGESHADACKFVAAAIARRRLYRIRRSRLRQKTVPAMWFYSFIAGEGGGWCCVVALPKVLLRMGNRLLNPNPVWINHHVTLCTWVG